MFEGNCNLCLAVNRKTVNIMNTHLQTLYEELAKFKVSPQLSLWLCCVCHTRLKQCHQLSMLARQTCYFLTNELCLQTNTKVKSEGMGLVNLSSCSTLNYAVPSPTSNSILPVLVKKEPFSLVFNEALQPCDDLDNTEDWHSDNSKYYTKVENIDATSYADIKEAVNFKNEVEIDINAYNGGNEMRIKEEIVEEEIEKKNMKGRPHSNPQADPGTPLFTCNICGHLSTTRKSLIKHKKTHNTNIKGLKASGTIEDKDKLSKKKRVACSTCKKEYVDNATLERHRRIHLAIRPFSCDVCHKTFSRRDHCKKHARTHRAHTCPGCGEDFPAAAQQGHVCNPRPSAPYSCDACHESFHLLALYHAHKTDVHGASLLPAVMEEGERPDDPQSSPKKPPEMHIKKKYSCKECDATYTHSNPLRSHVLAKHSKVRYECEHCTKLFQHRYNLQMHLLTHDDERRYCCDECGKTFTYKSSLNVHRRVHSGLKPYACDICNKKFTAFGQLAEHKLVHSDVRAFVCDICNKAFKRRRHLTTHIKSHTGEKPYTCDICFKGFAYNYNYVIHRRIHTGEKPFVCDVCEETFSDNRHLKKHKVVHE